MVKLGEFDKKHAAILSIKVFIASTLILGVIMFVAALFLGPYDLYLDVIVGVGSGLALGIPLSLATYLLMWGRNKSKQRAKS